MATLTRSRAALALGLGWLTLTSALFGGCDGLFRPAVPEPPSNVTPIVIDRSDPDSTLATLARGLGAKGQNGGTEAYLGAFADDPQANRIYRSFFDPADSARFAQSGGTVQEWNRLREQTFYARLIQNVRPGDAFRMEWARDQDHPIDDPLDQPEATIHRHYTLFADSPTGGSIIIGIGYADLLFYKSSEGQFLILRWMDRRDPVANPQDEDQVTFGTRRLEL
jgi:hypothetical protein